MANTNTNGIDRAFDSDYNIAVINKEARTDDIVDAMTKRFAQAEALLVSMISEDFTTLNESTRADLYWLLQDQVHQTRVLFDEYLHRTIRVHKQLKATA